jgi:polygalacturonase
LNKLTSPLNRRRFISTLSSAALLGCTALSGCVASDTAAVKRARLFNQAWLLAAKIRREIKIPNFPNREFLATDFGAKGDGVSDNSQAFAAAIAQCHQLGGGRVRVSKGQFLTGPIHLLSNVNLHLDDGCTLLFSTNVENYLPAVFTRWEGMELMGLSPLVYAFEQKNIAITGKGTLNGQANESKWWPWKGGEKWGRNGVANQDNARAKLVKDIENNRPVNERLYANGAQLRPPFIQFYRCKNALISDITITQSPFWLINPVLCDNLTVREVTCVSLGPNSDGCNPESCKNVVIENCFFDTGDDCIAIKSGRNADGRRINIPSQNIVIRGCQMRNGHGGVVIGSEISGGARNIFVENCKMDSPELERGIRIKTNSVRGGTIENIYFNNIKIGEVETAIVIDFAYEEGDSGAFTPRVRNIDIRNLHCENAKQVFNINGYERSPISQLNLINANFIQAASIGIIKNTHDFITENVTIRGEYFSLQAI